MSLFKNENEKIRCLLGWFGSACLIAILGCGSGEIQNFAGIRVVSDYRVDGIDLEIFLVDENGHALVWNSSILNPQIGMSTVSESKFTTNVQVYSMRQGSKGIKVYDGRLIDLRWSRVIGSSVRLLRAEIPRALINEDLQRDTEMGILTITIQTDKQGPFSDTVQKTQIYGRFR